MCSFGACGGVMGLGRIEEHPCVSQYAIQAANKQIMLLV